MVRRLALLVACLAVSFSCQADDAVRRELQGRYDRASAEAVAAKTYADAEATHRWLDTPDCTYTNTGQPTRSWTQMRGDVEAGLRTRLVGFKTTLESLDVKDDVAIATATVRGTARVTDERGDFGARGAAHDIVTTAKVRDVWVRAVDGWRRKSHEKIEPNRITEVDGKPRL